MTPGDLPGPAPVGYAGIVTHSMPIRAGALLGQAVVPSAGVHASF